MTETPSITVNWSTPFLDENDKPVEKLTLRDMVRPALLVEIPDSRSEPADKSARYDLWNKLRDGDELTVDDVQLIKKRIGVVCTPLVMGRIYDVLPK